MFIDKTSGPEVHERLTRLCEKLELEVLPKKPESGYYLQWNENQELGLRRAGFKEKPLICDFYEYDRKLKRPGAKLSSDLLFKAFKSDESLCVVDGTMGMAVDAYKMLFMGHSVVAYEGSPWVYSLVWDAVERGLAELPVLQKLTLNFGSLNLKEESLVAFDVLYLDPMFKKRKKALSKKAMQYLDEVCHSDDSGLSRLVKESVDLGKRVVVKRGVKLDPLSMERSFQSIKGNLIRYDIYRGAAES